MHFCVSGFSSCVKSFTFGKTDLITNLMGYGLVPSLDSSNRLISTLSSRGIGNRPSMCLQFAHAGSSEIELKSGKNYKYKKYLVV